MNYKIDLHTHSNVSDGACTPSELVELAAKENIKAMALTDHDNIGGVEEAAICARNNNIKFLTGIEFSALYNEGRILHILGIGIDLSNNEFLSAYHEMKKARERSVKHILLELRGQGINIEIKELKKKKIGQYLDRYDIYRYFVENKICKTAQEIWDKYLDLIPYGNKELIEVKDAIQVIKKAGGLSFLAHYNKTIGFAGLYNDEIEKEIKYLSSIGLDGIERYYPSFTQEDGKFLDYLIERHELMISGGTDFHGKNRPEIKLGSGKDNNLSVPYDVYIKISRRLRNIILYE